MLAAEFLKTVTSDQTNFLARLLRGFADKNIRFCVLGGQGVNAYVDPVVSLDLDVVIAVEQYADVERWLSEQFQVEHYPHSVNVSAKGSALRVQLQTDPRYASFVERASLKDVLGHQMPVAVLEDVLQGKVWAAEDATRRSSKRQKDLADIARLIEAHPHVRALVPEGLLARLV